MPFSMQFGVTVTLLAATLAASVAGGRRRPEPLQRPLETIPRTLGGWSAAGSRTLEPEILGILRPSAYLSRTYRRNGGALGLFIVYYDEQRSGEAVHSPRACLPGHGWEVREPGTAVVPVEGRPVKINRYRIGKAGERRVALYWYQSRRHIVANEYAGKLLLAWDALVAGRTSGSLVRVMVPDTPEAVAEGAAFAAEVMRAVGRCL